MVGYVKRTRIKNLRKFIFLHCVPRNVNLTPSPREKKGWEICVGTPISPLVYGFSLSGECLFCIRLLYIKQICLHFNDISCRVNYFRMFWLFIYFGKETCLVLTAMLPCSSMTYLSPHCAACLGRRRPTNCIK